MLFARSEFPQNILSALCDHCAVCVTSERCIGTSGRTKKKEIPDSILYEAVIGPSNCGMNVLKPHQG
jgi:hypothetical protein